MNSRTRLFLIIALIIVAVAVVAVLLLNEPGTTTPTATPDTTQVGQQPTRDPADDATPEPTQEPIVVQEVVIAVQDIPRGLPIAENMVALITMPEQYAPFSAFASTEAVIGKIARTAIAREEIIIQGKVVDDLVELANSGDIGSDAAAVLPSNRVLVAVPMDRLTSVAYAIQPGDRVDVIASLLFVNVDETFQSQEPNAFSLIGVGEADSESGTVSLEILEGIQGRFDSRIIPGLGTVPVIVRPSEPPRPRLATQRTIQNALVVNVGNFPADGRLFVASTPTPLPDTDEDDVETPRRVEADGTPLPPTEVPRPDIIALAVSPQDAVVLTWYVEAGIPITFALRSASSTSLAETDPVTLDYIMNRFRISLPDLLPYSIEPAIRSIRQLEVGTRIQLNNNSDDSGDSDN